MKSQKTVLVVEDDHALQEAIKFKLEQAGANVLAAGSGEEALEILKSHYPDFIMLDILLPGMDGLEVLRHIRENALLQGLPVAIMSVSAGAEKIKEAFSLNVVDYFIKSEYRIDEITFRVMNYLKPSKNKIKNKKIPKKSSHHQCVLVIEDDPPTLESILFKLKQRGFETDHALDGASGFEKLSKKGPFLGVLLDVLMPGSNGLSFLEKKNEDGRFDNVPVLVFSNFGQPEYIARALQLGARGYLVKAHHSIEDIVTHIDRCFNKNDCSVDTHYSDK